MYAPNLPDPWMIDELEKVRRNRESRDERPALELPLPLPPPPNRPSDSSDRGSARTVIVIEL
jgi:hypothetical protein